MVTFTFLSDNSNAFGISLLTSIDCLFFHLARQRLVFGVMGSFLLKVGYFGYYETGSYLTLF